MNKVILIGNLTRDPELSTTPNGISICRFSIAVSRSFTSANGERETDFFNIVAWRGLGENCAKFLVKGKKVCVCGSIQNRSYDDKEGIKRHITDIVADDVEFLSPKTDSDSSGYQSPREKTVDLQPVDSDDLPF